VFQVQGQWQRAVGSQPDQPGQFNTPRGLALSPDEAFLLVVDANNHRVAVLRATDGVWVRQLMGPPGTLPNPFGVAVASSGEVLVSDVNRHHVMRFRSIDDDTVVGTLGSGRGSGPTQFDHPFGLVVLDRPVRCFRLLFNCAIFVFYFPHFFTHNILQEGSVVVIADCFNHRLALWRLGDGTVWKHLGSKGTEPGRFTYPTAVALTGAGDLVVTDDHRVQVLSVDGAVLCLLEPTAVAGVGRLGNNLFGVTVCAGTDDILVTDHDNHRVVALTWSPDSNVRFCFLIILTHLLLIFVGLV
jgi:DNA-binding beta-propeller fold protein YncE